jgi:hypothetical protein
MVGYRIVVDAAVEYILGLRKMAKAKDAVWEAYRDLDVRCVPGCGSGLKILLLNTPCWGFGDIIFGMKIARYLRKWYGAKVTIATTHFDKFVELGESPSNLVRLLGKSKYVECRRFAKLRFESSIPVQDLIFVAPVQASYDGSIPDVKKLIGYATIFNTYFFSEYNDSSWKALDFPTGIGGKNLGILISKPEDIPKGRVKGLSRPYAMAYLADFESVPGAEKCFMSFLTMVAAKYKSRHTKFDVVVPPWVTRNIGEFEDEIEDVITVNYPTIKIVTKVKGKVVKKTLFEGDGGNVLTIRGDILPCSNKTMLQLMVHSVDDILLTGDQSISDALSCCPSKNIFYQIAEWKESFGKQLAEQLPNKFLLKKKTACGSLEAIGYKSAYGNFLKKWNFSVIGKPRLDAVILAAEARKASVLVREFEAVIGKSRTLGSLKDAVDAF